MYMPIIDKTKEFYPDLPDAEYLIFEDPSVPKGVTISKSNVMMTMKGKLVVKKVFAYWGWSSGNSFYRNFNSPEEAIKHYNDLIDWHKKNEK